MFNHVVAGRKEMAFNSWRGAINRRVYGTYAERRMNRVKEVCKGIKDHVGKAYKTISAMCKAYCISVKQYISRIKRGYSIKEALTGRVEISGNAGNTVQVEVYDKYDADEVVMEENEVSGVDEHNEVSGVDEHNEIEHNAIKKNIFEMNVKPMTDHEGRFFETKRELCEYWNIDQTTLNSRLRKGMNLEEALTTPVNIKFSKIRHGESYSG